MVTWTCALKFFLREFSCARAVRAGPATVPPAPPSTCSVGLVRSSTWPSRTTNCPWLRECGASFRNCRHPVRGLHTAARAPGVCPCRAHAACSQWRVLQPGGRWFSRRHTFSALHPLLRRGTGSTPCHSSRYRSKRGLRANMGAGVGDGRLSRWGGWSLSVARSGVPRGVVYRRQRPAYLLSNWHLHFLRVTHTRRASDRVSRPCHAQVTTLRPAALRSARSPPRLVTFGRTCCQQCTS